MVRLLFFLSIFISTACSVYRQPPTLILKSNDSDHLLSNGYYYSKLNSKFYETIFLYKNGVILEGDDIKTMYGLDSLDKKYLSSDYLGNSDYRRQVPWIWGIYSIKGDSVILERYVTPIFGETYQTYVQQGKILNNREFVITSTKYNKSGKIESVQDTFRFRPLNVKPDSTNNFLN